MAWIDALTRSLHPVSQIPHWGSLVFCTIFVLFWTRLGPRVRFFRVRAWVAVIVGGLLYPITILFVQPELEKTARDLLVTLFEQHLVDSRPLLSGLALVLVRSAGQEALQIVGIVFVLFLLGFRGDLATALGVGMGIGIGFGVFELQLAFRPVLAEGLSKDSIFPLTQGLFLIGAHLGTGLMLGRAWVDGRYVRYFSIATLLHGALGYASVLQLSGWSELATLGYFAAFGMLAFMWGATVAGARLR